MQPTEGSWFGLQDGELAKLVGAVDGQLLPLDDGLRDIVGDEEHVAAEDGGVDADDEPGFGQLVETEGSCGVMLRCDQVLARPVGEDERTKLSRNVLWEPSTAS